jgi:hypothetical protein
MYVILTFKRFLPLRAKKKKSKAIPVTGHGGPYGCEIMSIRHCLDNRLTDGGKVVGIARRPRFTHQKPFSASGTHF